MTSTMRFDKWENTLGQTVANAATSGQFYYPGSVVQVQTVRSDSRTTISSNNSGNGTTITQLNLSIAPKFENSKLIMQWMINGEQHQDNVFLIHKDGALITTAGETGYNAESGNVRWSGIASGFYDQNESSTPSNWFIQYSCISGSTVSQTFAPATRSSSTSNFTFFLNRTFANLGQDGHETLVSTGTIWEIAQ
jgi:hypothetical protein